MSLAPVMEEPRASLPSHELRYFQLKKVQLDRGHSSAYLDCLKVTLEYSLHQETFDPQGSGGQKFKIKVLEDNPWLMQPPSPVFDQQKKQAYLCLLVSFSPSVSVSLCLCLFFKPFKVNSTVAVGPITMLYNHLCVVIEHFCLTENRPHRDCSVPLPLPTQSAEDSYPLPFLETHGGDIHGIMTLCVWPHQLA